MNCGQYRSYTCPVCNHPINLEDENRSTQIIQSINQERKEEVQQPNLNKKSKVFSIQGSTKDIIESLSSIIECEHTKDYFSEFTIEAGPNLGHYCLLEITKAEKLITLGEWFPDCQVDTIKEKTLLHYVIGKAPGVQRRKGVLKHIKSKKDFLKQKKSLEQTFKKNDLWQ